MFTSGLVIGGQRTIMQYPLERILRAQIQELIKSGEQYIKGIQKAVAQVPLEY